MAKKCFFNLVLLLTVGALVHAQIPNVGWCPEYLPMTDFDMNRFLGKWYEAERYFTFTEVVSRCVVTDYAKAPSGRIYVSNEVTNRLTGVKRIINGNMELLGKGDEGRIHVKYATTPIPTETTLTVLETDYDNFAVVWSCSGFGPIHAQNAWLMTRERLPSGNTLQKGYGVLDKFRISRTFFVKTDQEGCYLAASDINAANGITAQSTVPEYSGSDQRDEESGDFRTAGVIDEKSAAIIDKKLEELSKPVAPAALPPTPDVSKVEEPEKKKDEKVAEAAEPAPAEPAPAAPPAEAEKPAILLPPVPQPAVPIVSVPEHILKKDEEVKKPDENVVKS